MKMNKLQEWKVGWRLSKVWIHVQILVENKKTTIDDDIDRGREMDDDDVRDWEKNLIKGSYIPGNTQNSVVRF